MRACCIVKLPGRADFPAGVACRGAAAGALLRPRFVRDIRFEPFHLGSSETLFSHARRRLVPSTCIMGFCAWIPTALCRGGGQLTVTWKNKLLHVTRDMLSHAFSPPPSHLHVRVDRSHLTSVCKLVLSLHSRRSHVLLHCASIEASRGFFFSSANYSRPGKVEPHHPGAF